MAEGDSAYFRYTVIVAAIMFLVALAHVGSKPGRAWAAIRQSESAALAAGVNTTFYKLYAFTLAAFMTGVAGGLYAGYEQTVTSYEFSSVKTVDNVILLAVVLMGGIFSLWGAVVAALLQELLPWLLQNWFTFFEKNPDFLLVIFGVGLLQVLVTAPEGIVTQFPKDMRNLGRLLAWAVRRVTPRGEAS
jgi:branched-chain amino acid transport system permease protein